MAIWEEAAMEIISEYWKLKWKKYGDHVLIHMREEAKRIRAQLNKIISLFNAWGKKNRGRPL